MKRLCAAGLLLGCLAWPVLQATEAPVDADLLEFLGSVDSEGDGWSDYLAQTDIDKVAKAPPAAGDKNAQVNDP